MIVLKDLNPGCDRCVSPGIAEGVLWKLEICRHGEKKEIGNWIGGVVLRSFLAVTEKRYCFVSDFGLISPIWFAQNITIVIVRTGTHFYLSEPDKNVNIRSVRHAAFPHFPTKSLSINFSNIVIGHFFPYLPSIR